MAAESGLPEDVVALVSKLELKDDMDSPFTIQAVTQLDPARRAIYAVLVPELKSGFAASVECTNDSGETVERIVLVSEDKASTKDIVLDCKISMEEYSPSGMVEYRYSEGADWMLAQMSLASLEYYRSGKFKIWRKLLLEPDCEAAFKRMLQVGIITRMFDSVAFPMPEEEVPDWQVTNDKGKIVQIPRPLQELRVYNAASKKYESVSVVLDGAPSEEEKAEYWRGMLDELRAKHGADYIAECMADSKDSSSSAMAV